MHAVNTLIFRNKALSRTVGALLAAGFLPTLAQAQQAVITEQTWVSQVQPAASAAPALPAMAPPASTQAPAAPPMVTLPASGAELARVISVTPVVQQAVVPQTTCNTETQPGGPTSGAGAMVGALAGAAVGSTMGGGSGNALATAIGFLGGAALGNQAEAQGNTQVTRRCVTQNVTTSVTVYNVVYEYAGKQYATQMSRDPGPTVQVQISPVGTSTVQTGAAPTSEINQSILTTSSPVVRVVDPYYYYPRYYPNVVWSIGVPIGRGHRHWR